MMVTRPGKKGAMKKNEQIKTKKIIRIYSSRFIFGTNRVYRPAHCSMRTTDDDDMAYIFIYAQHTNTDRCVCVCVYVVYTIDTYGI